jgi:hypothetical protein
MIFTEREMQSIAGAQAKAVLARQKSSRPEMDPIDGQNREALPAEPVELRQRIRLMKSAELSRPNLDR